MGAYPVLRRFTHQEYLALERASPGRNEFIDGLIYAMAGGTYAHDMLVANTSFLLQSQLTGGPCSVRTANFVLTAVGATLPVAGIYGGSPALDSVKR